MATECHLDTGIGASMGATADTFRLLFRHVPIGHARSHALAVAETSGAVAAPCRFREMHYAVLAQSCG
jgi:hypothetical protein